MEGKQSEYDFLNLSKNYTIKNNITREEEIQFSDKITKINNRGWKQERNIIITDKAIYNLKKLTLKRRIDLKTIIGITITKLTDEFVVHCSDIDYDYQYSSKRRKTILEIIAKNYELINEEELKLFELSVKSLSTIVTTKKEKEKQKNFTRMPKNGMINIKDYLFGGKGDNKGKKGLKMKSTFKNVPVEYTDFEIIKIIGSCESDLYLSSSGIVRCVKCGDTFKIISKNYFCNNCQKENKKDNSSKLQQLLYSINEFGRIEENLSSKWVCELVKNIMEEMKE